MGIRSDVAICMKKSVVDSLSPGAQNFLEEWGFEEREKLVDEHAGDSEDQSGTLFYTEDVKWYSETYPDIIKFLQHLERYYDEQDYYIIQACGEHPEADFQRGEWYDNPWNVYKAVSVELAWDSA